LRAVAESVSTRPPAAATPAGGRLRIGSRLRRPPTWPWSRCWTRRADAVPPALRTGQGHPAPGSRFLLVVSGHGRPIRGRGQADEPACLWGFAALRALWVRWPCLRGRWCAAGGQPWPAPRPGCRGRAKDLLWAAGKLAGWATGLGLDPAPQVLLHPSVIERFTAHAPGLSGPGRRTLRTKLRFIALAVVPHMDPADAPLPRERAKAPVQPGGDQQVP